MNLHLPIKYFYFRKVFLNTNMLTMVLILAITSTLLELMIAARIPLWRKWSYRSKLFNLLNSMFLSYLIGLAFGAQGLIAMTAGILSTFLTIPGYTFLHWNYDSDKALDTPEKNRLENTKNKVKQTKQKISEPTSDLFKMTYFTAKVVTSPLWVPRRVYRKFKKA